MLATPISDGYDIHYDDDVVTRVGVMRGQSFQGVIVILHYSDTVLKITRKVWGIPKDSSVVGLITWQGLLPPHKLNIFGLDLLRSTSN